MIFRARQLLMAIGLIAAFLGNASASPNTITIQGGRPVDKAIQELEKRYGWQITYEDPPYVHYGDITDVSDTNWPGTPLQSQSQLQSVQPSVQPSVLQSAQREPGAHNRALVPKGGSLSFNLPSADPVELGAVEALLRSYNESHRGFEFAVVRGASLLHVVPRKARGLSGNLEPVTPVLDTIITIEPRERTSGALLEEICNKISIATNTNVVMPGIPGNMLSLTKTSIGGPGKTARSILEQWLLEGGGRLSWHLFYEPAVKWYILNIREVDSVKKQ
jgi:hypothetical protein